MAGVGIVITQCGLRIHGSSYGNQRLVVDCEHPFPLGVDDGFLGCIGCGDDPGEHGFELGRTGVAVPAVEKLDDRDQARGLPPCDEFTVPHGEVEGFGGCGLRIDVALDRVEE